jgi:ABC-type nitrate/sulfonate/bicarbonate transport system substrate-binding protein
MRPWLLFLIIASCLGCSSTARKGDAAFETLELRYEGMTGTVSVVELAEDLGYLAPIKLTYVGNNATGGPHSLQAVVSGDLDIGSSFNGAIIKMVASKAPLRSVVAAYGTDGEAYSGFFVLDDSPVHSARDLIGKAVSLNTLGAHAEFALREYLARGGLSPEQIKQVTVLALPPVHGEMALRMKQVQAAHLINTFRDKALDRGGVRKLFSDHDMWGSFNAGSYVMSKRFVAEHPKTVRKFVEAVGKAHAWSRSQSHTTVRARMEAIIHTRKRNEDASAVAYWKSYGAATELGQLSEREFSMWIEWLERDGQLARGQVRPSDVYTNEFQPASARFAQRVP